MRQTELMQKSHGTHCAAINLVRPLGGCKNCSASNFCGNKNRPERKTFHRFLPRLDEVVNEPSLCLAEQHLFFFSSVSTYMGKSGSDSMSKAMTTAIGVRIDQLSGSDDGYGGREFEQ